MARLVASPIEVPVAERHEQLSPVRLCDPRALDATGQSFERHGQLSAIELFVQDGELQLLDGFKRLQAAPRMQWNSLRRCADVLPSTHATPRPLRSRSFRLVSATVVAYKSPNREKQRAQRRPTLGLSGTCAGPSRSGHQSMNELRPAPEEHRARVGAIRVAS